MGEVHWPISWRDVKEHMKSNGSGYEIPFFDLNEMGLPPIVFAGDKAVVSGVDLTEIYSAFSWGPIKIRFSIEFFADEVIFVEAIVTGVGVMPSPRNNSCYICTILVAVDDSNRVIMDFSFTDNSISATAGILQ